MFIRLIFINGGYDSRKFRLFERDNLSNKILRVVICFPIESLYIFYSKIVFIRVNRQNYNFKAPFLKFETKYLL